MFFTNYCLYVNARHGVTTKPKTNSRFSESRMKRGKVMEIYKHLKFPSSASLNCSVELKMHSLTLLYSSKITIHCLFNFLSLQSSMKEHQRRQQNLPRRMEKRALLKMKQGMKVLVCKNFFFFFNFYIFVRPLTYLTKSFL